MYNKKRIDKHRLTELMIQHSANHCVGYSMDPELGGLLLRMAGKVSYTIKGYYDKDDLTMSGVEIAVRRIHKFNPDKGMNGFAYATTLLTTAMINEVVKKDKRYVRNTYIMGKEAILKQINDNPDQALQHYNDVLADLENLFDPDIRKGEKGGRVIDTKGRPKGDKNGTT